MVCSEGSELVSGSNQGHTTSLNGDVISDVEGVQHVQL